MNDTDVLRIGIASALRHSVPIIRTLYASGVSKHLDTEAACETVALRPDELKHFLAQATTMGRGQASTSSFEAKDSVHRDAVDILQTALAIKLAPHQNKQAWNSSVTRCAAVLAATGWRSSTYQRAKEVSDASATGSRRGK